VAFGRRESVWLAIAVIAVAAGAQWGWINGVVSVLAIAAIVDLVLHQFRGGQGRRPAE
jgi:hypothetical protein